jgi:hypothetical protein
MIRKICGVTFVLALALMHGSAAAAESAFPAEPGFSSNQSGPLVPARPAVPSKFNEQFAQLRATCEKDVPVGKANGDVCVEAANILVGSDQPDEFRDMTDDQRIKIALRLLEKGVDSSNLARARAFDYYDKIGFLGMSAYADQYRAKELMEMMVAANYPGGTLRKIRSQTTILSFGVSEAEKRAGCAEAKRILKEVKLDADSTRIAQDIVGSGICTGYEAQPAAK